MTSIARQNAETANTNLRRYEHNTALGCDEINDTGSGFMLDIATCTMYKHNYSSQNFKATVMLNSGAQRTKTWLSYHFGNVVQRR